MTVPAIFEFEAREIRVVTDDRGDIWFVANDVCHVLGHSNPRKAVADHVDAEDVTKRYTLTEGGNQQAAHVNESGLYALIFGSQLKTARDFKRWVTREVLPAIRKTGEYRTASYVAPLLEDKDLRSGANLRTKLRLQEQSFVVMRRLQEATTAAEKRNLYWTLLQINSALGIPTDTMEALGVQPPQVENASA